MANQLDELNAPVMEQGRDVNVIAKVIPVEATGTEKALPYLIMLVGIIVTIYGLVNDKYIVDAVGIIIFIFPWWQMQQISSEFNMMEQRIQTAASEIDNYMEQRVVILETLENQVKKSIETDKNTFVDIAKYRSDKRNPRSTSFFSRLHFLEREFKYFPVPRIYCIIIYSTGCRNFSLQISILLNRITNSILTT